MWYSEAESRWLVPTPVTVMELHGYGSDSPPNSEYSGSSHQQPQGDSRSNTSPPLSDFELSQFEASEEELQDPESAGGEEYCESEQGEIEVWDESEGSAHDTSDDDYFTQESPPIVSQANDGNEIHESDRSARHLVTWLVSFLLLLHARYHLTDRVVNLLFGFLKAFLKVLGRLYSVCSTLGTMFPPSLCKARKDIGSDMQRFRRYVVCKKCHKIYTLSDCIEGYGQYQSSKSCSHIPWPSTRNRGHTCGATLLKTVELATGRKLFYPLMTYCYVDLKTSLQRLLLSSELIKESDKWRMRSVPEGVLADIYDGNVWKQFISYEGRPFLIEQCSFAFMINVDWFQPYKHLRYSVGAIYLTLLNLPRSVRYKLNNICLIGILPGPHEPERSINTYIDPLVNELQEFWKGVELNVSITSCPERKLVRCAVICASCDLPAGRKLCGFLGHSARLGCSKCFKEFLGSLGNQDFSGFLRENWTPRTGPGHRDSAFQLLHCSSKTELKRKESELGCRYSSLLKLPCFDAPKMLAIDPMHNLFLGTAKHFIKNIWIAKEILSCSGFETIQKHVDSMVVPTDIGSSVSLNPRTTVSPAEDCAGALRSYS